MTSPVVTVEIVINKEKYSLDMPIINEVVCYPDGEQVPTAILDMIMSACNFEKNVKLHSYGNGNFRFISLSDHGDN